jgi:hypothetical protein
MTAWRIWFTRNEVTHDKELPTIEGSRRFICSYMRSLENIKHVQSEDIIKGKQAIVHDERKVLPKERPVSHAMWTRPWDGETKLNIDGAFLASTAQAGAGVIARRSDGSIIFVACRSLSQCTLALEAELIACIDSVRFVKDMGIQ